MPLTSRLLLGLLLMQAIANFIPRTAAAASQRNDSAAVADNYLGFDRNIYPGDAALPVLRKDFSFAGFWISPPPGETSNTWIGKRALLRQLGFGFLVLYRGREVREIKNAADSADKGKHDARDGAASAKREGFPAGTIVFLDVEEGGRLPPAYHAYLRAWADALIAAGYHPGVYCSAMPVNEGHGVQITTADDIRNNDDIRANEAPRGFSYWVYNDACPPAPGCVAKKSAPAPSRSGTPYAAVWQFAQSPRRKEFTARCAATYARDGNCYAPGDAVGAWFLDLNSSTSADPSGGAK
ncbi:MAG TPA: glycoside hydrolase domain-containing protein [Candidatus Acidoferrum sp.]|nr:glycoside hydrolase domain-containing protein [Candidatus Acidoferrum sp.]